MSAGRAVLAADLRTLVRDRTVLVLPAVPLVLVLALRLGTPVLERHLPAAAEYRPALLAVFAAVSALLPALVLAFVLLDERDQGLFTVFRVLPVPAGRFLSYRLGTATVLGLLFPLAVTAGAGTVHYPLPRLLLLAALCALGAPLALLAAVAAAGDKIEGLTVFKGLFFLLAVPAAAPAVPGGWGRLLGVLPGYWTYRAFEPHGPAALAGYAAVAVLWHGALIAAARRAFLRRSP